MSIFQRQHGGDGVSQTQIINGNGNTVIGVSYSDEPNSLSGKAKESHYGIRNGFKAFSKDFRDLIETLKWVQDERYPGEWLLEQSTPGDESTHRFRRIRAFKTKKLLNAFITDIQWEKVLTIPYLFFHQVYHQEYCSANLYYDVSNGLVYKLEQQFGNGIPANMHVTCLDDGMLVPLCINESRMLDISALWSNPSQHVFYDPKEDDKFYVERPTHIIEMGVSKPQLLKAYEWVADHWMYPVMVLAIIVGVALSFIL